MQKLSQHKNQMVKIMGRKEIIEILETALDGQWELAEKMLNERIQKLQKQITEEKEC